MSSEALGRHILVEYYDCNEDILKDVDKIEQSMINAAKESNATIIESVFHQFNPWGVSGAVIISESHLTIHTWPEYSYAAVDFFTCGDIDCDTGIDLLKQLLKSKKYEVKKILRGQFKSEKSD